MRRIVAAVTAAALIGGVAWLAVQRMTATAPPGTLYGNVEIRQVDLSFNAEGTVVAMPKHEGDRVKQGETIAELDPATYQSAADLAAARRDAAKAQLDLLVAGTRPEDVDQARANLAAAQASLANAEATFERQKSLTASNASTKQLLDDARMALDAGRAKVDQTQAALTEAVNGPRPEDIAAARAQLRAAEATVDLARTQLARTRLIAPANGTIMTRVIEPGTVVLPGSNVYSMALDDEVWVRSLRPRAAAAAARARHRGQCHRRRDGQGLSRPHRLCLARGGVHAQDSRDPRTPHPTRLSAAHPRSRTPTTASARACR